MKLKFWIIAIIIVILDQITKILLQNKHFGIINYATNTGAAFSLFSNSTTILTIISFFMIGAIIYFYKKHSNAAIPLALLLGGTIGNFIDRGNFGYVRDFIDLKFWPIFNIADSANVMGAIILIYLIWKDKL